MAQPRGHMGTQERLRDISRHTLEAIFQVMTVVVNYSKGQKQMKKIVLHPKSTLTRPPIYDRAKPEMLSTASPGNSVSMTNLSSLLLFVQPDKKVFGRVAKTFPQRVPKETYFLTNFGSKSTRKVRSQSKLASKSIAIHIAQTVPQFT